MLKRHLAALALAILVGLVMISSQLALRSSLIGVPYRGVPPILSPSTQDDAWYHAVIHEAMEGGKPWNAILAENKNATYPVPDLAERIMALPARVFGLTADTVILAWRFILPFLLTLAIYGVSLYLIRSRLFACGVAVLVLFATYFMYDPGFVVSVLRGTTHATLYTTFDRPVHPQFEAPFLWLFLLGATQLLNGKRSRLWIVVGALLGFVTYTYAWAWTWGYAVMGVLLLVAIAQRERESLLAVLKAWGLGILLGLPALATLVMSIVSPAGAGYGERLALFHGHVFASANLNLSIVFALLLFINRRRFASPMLRVFVIAGLGGTFIAMNQQIVTGLSLQPDHYLALVGASFAVWVFAWAFWTWLSSRRVVVQRCVVGIAVVLSLVLMLGIQWRIFEQHRDYMAALQPFADVATYLNTHADRSNVVLANQNIGMLVPAMTDANLWWHFYAMSVPVDSARIMHSAFTWFELNGFTGYDMRRFAHADSVTFTQFFTLTTLYEERLALIDRNLDGWVAAYEKFSHDTTPAEAVRRYRVNEVLYDKTQDHWDPKDLRVGEKLVENERFVLYRVAQ